VVGILLAVAMLAAVVAVVAMQRLGVQGPPAAASVPVVRVVAVEWVQSVDRRAFSGILRARDRARLAFTISGRLAGRSVELGSSVGKGDVLAWLDDRPLQNQLAVADATASQRFTDLRRGARDRKRAQTLAVGGHLAAVDLEYAQTGERASRAAHRAASVQLREARRVLAEARLVAPFDAVVTEVMAEPQEFVAAGAPIITLSGTGPLELEVEVSEPVVPHLAEGTAVAVEVPTLEHRRLAGRVEVVGQAVPARGRLFPVVVSLQPSQGLVPGMVALVHLEIDRGGRLAVPVEAVVNPGGQDAHVFRVTDGAAERIAVEVVGIHEGQVTVLADLEPGQRIIVEGHGRVAPGDAVEIAGDGGGE
jgi:multidrug efflux system membrane fusion protein